MKKSKLYLLPLCFLVLTACQPSNGGDNPPKPEEKLATPVLTVNTEGTGLTWAAVPNAVSYSISVNDGAAESVTTPGYDFATEAGNYAVKVVAVASETKNNSEQASFDYSTSYTALASVAYADGFITWTGFAGAEIKYSIDGGQEVTATGDSIEVTVGGMYTIRAAGGFVEANNKYYVDNATSPNEKHILARPSVAEGIDLELGDEDSNADLQSKYTALKYGNSGWEASTVTMTLDRNNEGMSPNRCVRANVYSNGTWFKFKNDDFSCNGRVDYLSFYAKAASQSQTRLYFRWEVTEDTVIAGLNFKDVYVTYPIDNLASGWKQYNVSVNDAAWKINYNRSDMTFAQVQGLLSGFGYNVDSLGDFFQYFGNFAILAKSESTGNGPKSFVYIDEVKLGVGEIPQNKDYTVYEWAFTSNAVSAGYLKYSPDGESTMVVKLSAGAKIKFTPTITPVSATRFHVVVDSASYNLDAYLNLDNNGNFTLEDGATGNVASYLTGLVSDQCHVLFDFENFSNSGVGYDGAHKDETAWNGLRSKWYSDFYSGNSSNPSAVGGSGWSMMGSDDYLDLSKTVRHGGMNSMRLKYNSGNQMRFITWDFTQGPVPRLPKASYLTMYVRACAGRDNQLKIRAFFTEQISSANQGDTSKFTELATTVAADENNGWVKLTVELNQEKNYYGFVILPMKNSGSVTNDDTKYFYVDDIVLHNTINPFNYQELLSNV